MGADPKKILTFWKLCEYLDFETFPIDTDIFPLTSLSSHDSLSKIVDVETYTKCNEALFYKLYLGLIPVKKLIGFINKQLEQTESISIRDEEILKTDHFTYAAFVYLDHNKKIVSVDNYSLFINPLFYLLKALKHEKRINNIDLNDFVESLSQKFNERFCVEADKKTIVIISPDILKELSLKNIKPTRQNAYEFQVFDFVLERLQEESDYFKKLEEQEWVNVVSTPYGGETVENLEALAWRLVVEMADKDQKNYYLYVTRFKPSKPTEIPPNLICHKYFNNSRFEVARVKQSCIEVVDTELENKLINFVTSALEIPKDLLYHNKTYLFCKEHKVSLFQIHTLPQTLLTSFYVDALNEEPRNLTLQYIQGTAEKIDVNENKEIRKKINDFSLFRNCKAKWPSKYALYYAQQCAVNLFLDKFQKGSYLFSVNGPPGTGKTTLLRDVIANVVVQKTLHLRKSGYQLFDKNGDFSKELSGKYEIVVTSSLNSAVENITKELPQFEAFDFSAIEASPEEFLLYPFVQKFYGTKSWGLISYALGKADNIREFEKQFSTLLEEIEKSVALQKIDFSQRLAVLSREFDALLKDIERSEEEIATYIKNKERLPEVIDKIEIIQKELQELQKKTSSKRSKLSELEESKSVLFKKIEKLKEQKSLLEENRATFTILQKLFFKRGEYKRLKEELLSLNYKLYEAYKEAAALETEQSELESDILDLQNLYKEKERRVASLNEQVEQLQKRIAAFEAIKIAINNNEKIAINDDEYFSQSEGNIQLGSLFAKQDYLKKRAKLFKLSMQINETLFLLHLGKFKKAINFYSKNYFRSTLTTAEKEKLQRAFSALTFLFPVISTTLASSYKMFRNIEQIGVVLCDEAGQAIPQSFVGVLNRARNALIVGDPLQIEPVFTAPEMLIKRVQEIYNVEERYSPLSSSVQKLADRANEYGSYYTVDGEREWVGMPLVVHRRCIDPMFTIANKISYNEKMVLPDDMKKKDTVSLPPSCWIDVPFSPGDFKQNSSEREIEAVKRFLQWHRIDECFIISPFKSIKIFQENFKAYRNVDIGTVHTFQGKESDVVFFVLGGRNNGAKRWASSKANILNVAVTRAKQRIYIVGDYQIWKEHRFFETACQILPRKEIDELLV